MEEPSGGRSCWVTSGLIHATGGWARLSLTPHVSEKAPSSEAARLACGRQHGSRCACQASNGFNTISGRHEAVALALLLRTHPVPTHTYMCTVPVLLRYRPLKKLNPPASHSGRRTDGPLSQPWVAVRLWAWVYNEKKTNKPQEKLSRVHRRVGPAPEPTRQLRRRARRMTAWGVGTGPQEGQHAVRGGIGPDGV